MKYSALGAFSGLIAVLAGSFGAHLLRGQIAADMMEVFDLGARYQLVHALPLLILGREDDRAQRPRWRLPCACFALGTLFFSGSLYTLALSANDAWGAVTPLGGLGFILGWATLAYRLWRGEPGPASPTGD